MFGRSAASALPDTSPYQGVLDELLLRLPALDAAILAQTDGFEVAEAARRPVAVSRAAALSGSLLALGQAALRELGSGGPDGCVLVESQAGKLLLLEVPDAERPMVLALLADRAAVTGGLLWSAREAVKKLMSPNPEKNEKDL